MADTSYQNQDIENLNPLRVDIPDTSTPKPRKNYFTLPTDPKMKILYILVGIVVLLFVISIPVTLIKNSNPSTKGPTPTPVPFVTPLPTEVVNITNIPDDLKAKFEKVDSESQINVNFPPPQIDTEIGL